MQERHTCDDLQFPDLVIQGFRGIKELKIPQLGRVTLITGKNNSGKSSILEALRIHTGNAAFNLVREILSSREEYNRGRNTEQTIYGPENLSQISTLFHGFPSLSEEFAPIVISTSGRTRPMSLTMEIGWFVEREEVDGYTRLVPRGKSASWEPGDIAALVASTESRKQINRLERFIRPYLSPPIPGPREEMRMPCIFVSPYAGEETDALEYLWASVALTNERGRCN